MPCATLWLSWSQNSACVTQSPAERELECALHFSQVALVNWQQAPTQA
jgi:hypothetical protein